jgi:hypothetical protein
MKKLFDNFEKTDLSEPMWDVETEDKPVVCQRMEEYRAARSMINNYFRYDLGDPVTSMEELFRLYKTNPSNDLYDLAWTKASQLLAVLLWISDAWEVFVSVIEAYQKGDFTVSALPQLQAMEGEEHAQRYEHQIAGFLSRKKPWLEIPVRIFNYLKYRLD